MQLVHVLTVISSPAESLVSFQVQSANSLQNPRDRPRSTCPTPRTTPRAGRTPSALPGRHHGPARPCHFHRQPVPGVLPGVRPPGQDIISDPKDRPSRFRWMLSGPRRTRRRLMSPGLFKCRAVAVARPMAVRP